MLTRGSRFDFGNPFLLMVRVGVSLGIVGMLMNGSAIAAPLFPNANSSTEAEQPKSAGDVVVDTESQKPDATQPEAKTEPSPGSTTGATKPANTRFTCQYVNGQFVVMYHPESQPGQSYPWATPGTMGGGWTPERRCGEISRRLEFYRPDGLQEMRTGMENGYNVVCVTTQKVPACRIVLTVPAGQDPTMTRDRVFQNLTVADSGQQTQAVNTFTGTGGDQVRDVLGRVININLPSVNLPEAGGLSRSTDGIDLRPFLDRADGGTGAYLGGDANRPVPRLNPDKFR